MTKLITYLPWDSSFFGLKIGFVNWASNMSVHSIEQLAQASAYDLIYVFAPHTTCGIDFKHVDSKVIYSKSLGVGKVNECVKIADVNIDCDALYRLALISGIYSRFKIDEKLPVGSYERMYKEWIKKSMSGDLADYIFVYRGQDGVNGMITVKLTDTTANIGLIAVDYDAQGRGIASKLIQTVENYLYRLGSINTLTVATQLANHNACHLYEKNGFKISSITDIYHYWVK